MNPEIEKQLMMKIKRADRVIFWCILGLLLVVVVLFVIILIQNQKNADKSRQQVIDTALLISEQEKDNHKRTQGFIICVTNILQKPLDQRGDLNACLKAAQERTKEAD